MNLQQTLAALDTASMTLDSADARRVMADAAMSLRTKLQQHNEVVRLRQQLAKLHGDTSLQGEAQRADLLRRINDCGDADLTAALDKAHDTLKAWEGF